MDSDSTLVDLCQFSDYHNATAVIYDDGQSRKTLTYKLLKEISDQVTDLLSMYSDSSSVVGICMETKLITPAIIIGILKANSAFYSFDGDALQYVTHVIQTVGCRIILTDSKHIKHLESLISELDGQIKPCELYGESLYLISLRAVPKQTKTINLAYVITTSGTTGLPKKVKVPHACIVPNIVHIRELYNLSSDDLVLLCSPLTFDPSIVEIFTTLSTGATLLIVPSVIKMMPDYLLDIVCRNKVTVMQEACASYLVLLCLPLTFDPSIVEIFTTLSAGATLLIVPSIIKMMPDYLLDIVCWNKDTVMQATPTLLSRFGSTKLQNSLLGDNSSLRVMSLGGEKFPDVPVINSYRSRNNQTRFINLYGVTEVSCWATYYIVTEEDSRNERRIPLGECLSETVIEVRDESGKTINVGTGELFVGGYKRQCMLSTDPNENEYDKNILKLQATGDVVELDEKGNLFYVGRKDHQLKCHGKRINLEEIKQVSLKYKIIKDSITLMVETKLVTFVTVSHKHRSDLKTKIRLHMAQHLPSYSVPDDIVVIEYMPITKHGKVDHQRLTEIYETSIQSDKAIIYDTEFLLVQWKEKLNNKDAIITKDSNFVQIGGNSLTAIQLLNDMEKHLKTQLPYLLDKLLNDTFGACDEYISSVIDDKLQTSSTPYRNENKRKIDIEDVKDHSGQEQCKHVNERKIDLDALNQNTQEQFKHANKRKITEIEDDNEVVKEQSKDAPTQFRFAISRGNHCHKCSVELTLNDKVLLQNGADFDSLKALKKYKNDIKVTKSEDESFKNSMPLKNDDDRCLDENIIGDQNGYELDSIANKEQCLPNIMDKLQLNEMWRFNTGKCVDASPLIAVGKSYSTSVLYIGSHSHKFYSIDLTSGDSIWEITLADRIEAAACLSLCGSYVLVGCYDCHIYSLDCATGSVWWKFQTGSQVKCCPVVDLKTGLVYAGSHSHAVYCLNVVTRAVVWSNNLKSGSIFSSPTINYKHGTLLVATLGGKVFSINKTDGAIQWSYDFKKPVFSSLTCTQNGVLIGCTDTCLYHIDYSGHLMWKFKTEGPIFSSPSTGIFNHYSKTGPNIYIGSHDCMLYCLSIHGTLVWNTRVAAQVYATPFCCDLVINGEYAEFVVPEDFKDSDHHKSSYTEVISVVCDENFDIVNEKHCTVLSNDSQNIAILGSLNETKSDSCGPNKNYLLTKGEKSSKPSTMQNLTRSNSLAKSAVENSSCRSINTDTSNSNFKIHLHNAISGFKTHCDNSNTYFYTDSSTPNVCTSSDIVIPVVIFCSTNGTLYIVDAHNGHILCEQTLPGEVFSSPVCYKDLIIVGCRDDFVYKFKVKVESNKV